MSFWSGEALGERLPGLIDPFDPAQIDCAAYRLRGKGLPRVGEGGRGDVHVRVHVWTPVKLTAEQRALLEQLAKIESKPPSEGHAGKQFWEQLRQAFGR